MTETRESLTNFVARGVPVFVIVGWALWLTYNQTQLTKELAAVTRQRNEAIELAQEWQKNYQDVNTTCNDALGKIQQRVEALAEMVNKR